MTITNNEEIGEFLREMQTERQELQKVMVRLMWHMRGSLSRDEAWCLSPAERNDIVHLIHEHNDVIEKTGLPMF